MATDIIKVDGRIEFINTNDNHRITYYAGSYSSVTYTPGVGGAGIINIYGASNKRIDEISEINSITDGASAISVPSDLSGLYDLLKVYFMPPLPVGGGGMDPNSLTTTYRAQNFADIINFAPSPQIGETVFVIDPTNVLGIIPWKPGQEIYTWNGTAWTNNIEDVANALGVTQADVANIITINANQDTAIAANAAAAIAANQAAVFALQRSNHLGNQLHTTISDFDAGVRTNRLDQMAFPTIPLNLNNQRILNLGAPQSDNEAARFQDIPWDDVAFRNQAIMNQGTGFEPYLLATFDIPRAGNYILSSNAIVSMNTTGVNFQSHIVPDGSIDPSDYLIIDHVEMKDSAGGGILAEIISGGVLTGATLNSGTDQRVGVGGKVYIENLTAGTHTFILEWNGANANVRPTIYNAVIEIKEDKI